MSGFFSLMFWKGFLYWSTPFLVYFGSLFVIAFSRESFAGLIFITILMVHPIVTIPMATFVDLIRDVMLALLAKYSCSCLPNPCQRILKRVFTFTMISYLGCVMLCQYYLFASWIHIRQTLYFETYGVVTPYIEFKNKPFENCGDNSAESKAKSNWLLNVMATYDQYNKAWIVFGASMFFFAFHLMESFCLFLADPIPMANFLSGTPIVQNNNPDMAKVRESVSKSTVLKNFIMIFMYCVFRLKTKLMRTLSLKRYS